MSIFEVFHMKNGSSENFEIKIKTKLPVPQYPIVIVCKLFLLLQLGGELRHCLEQVVNEAIVRKLEERRLLILIYHYDYLRVLHSGDMLNCSRNTALLWKMMIVRSVSIGRRGNAVAYPDVKLRRNHLPSLTDLIFIRYVARINSST